MVEIGGYFGMDGSEMVHSLLHPDRADTLKYGAARRITTRIAIYVIFKHQF